MARPIRQTVVNGETIVGLSKIGKNRWRISQTGERFSQADPFAAVSYFRQKVRSRETLFVPIVKGDPLTIIEAEDNLDPRIAAVKENVDGSGGELKWDAEGAEHILGTYIDETVFWNFVKHLIRTKPQLVYQKTGATFTTSIPTDSLTLQFICDQYESKNPSKGKSKKEALNVFYAMMKFTGATLLSQLTTETLQEWKEHIEKSLGSGGTKTAYFSRIKTIIGFGLKVGMEARQIEDALLRCKVLWTASKIPQIDPTPISPEDFRTLLEVGGEKWNAWLLVGLNFCMHLDEVCEVKWSEIDFSKGTYASIRGKTANKRIPRAATLWAETKKALQKIKRRGASPYVFTSTHGTRYNRNTRGNDFKDLRIAAKLEHIKFDDLRDGAYTCAIQTPGIDEKFARVLAGHKSPGLQDVYVLRNPEIVRGCCDAVHKHYFGKV